MGDPGIAAFLVFFMPSPSFLAHQRQFEAGHGGSNCDSLSGIAKICSDNHIRDMLEPARPSLLHPVFAETVGHFRRIDGGFDVFRRLNGGCADRARQQPASTLAKDTLPAGLTAHSSSLRISRRMHRRPTEIPSRNSATCGSRLP